MGCWTYDVNGVSVKFAEADDTVPCLCDFDPEGSYVSARDVYALALLGAATLLIDWKQLHSGVGLPYCLPPKMVEGIVAHIKNFDPTDPESGR